MVILLLALLWASSVAAGTMFAVWTFHRCIWKHTAKRYQLAADSWRSLYEASLHRFN